MSYSLLMIDDEQEEALLCKEKIEELYPNDFEVTIMSDEQAAAALDISSYDAYILDIEMPLISGYTFARKLYQIKPDVLFMFLTTHEDLSIEGYEYHAFRFLVKSRWEEMLPNAMEALLYELNKREAYVTARNEASLVVDVPIKDIICIYSEKNYLNLVTLKGIYRIRSSIHDFMEEYKMFPFVSPQNGHVVNLEKVKSVDYDSNRIYLQGGNHVKISYRRKKAFLERYAKGY